MSPEEVIKAIGAGNTILPAGNVRTGDLDRLKAFYCDVLHFEVMSEGGWEPGSPLVDDIESL